MRRLLSAIAAAAALAAGVPAGASADPPPFAPPGPATIVGICTGESDGVPIAILVFVNDGRSLGQAHATCGRGAHTGEIVFP